jgi:hypothetical protein
MLQRAGHIDQQNVVLGNVEPGQFDFAGGQQAFADVLVEWSGCVRVRVADRPESAAAYAFSE